MKSQGRLLLLVIIVADLLIVLAVLGSRLIKSQQPTQTAAQKVISPQTSPGLVVYGTVRNTNGVGIANAAIYRNYASYPGEQIAETNAAGYYQSDFYAIPGDEMVSVWVKVPGMVFTPELCSWRHYAGYEMKACNFTSSTNFPVYLPLLRKMPE